MLNNAMININLGSKAISLPYEQLAIAVLSILYLIGIIGIAIPIHPDFVLLTPINLLVSLFTVLLFHKTWDRATVTFIVAAYLLGYGAEVLGIQTGLLFGDYIYGPVLGPQIWETPLMIGVNWVMLAYCSGIFINHIFPKINSKFFKALLATGVMLLLDILIEPVAIDQNFWTWIGRETPPLHNFIGWGIVAFIVLSIFMHFLAGRKNKVAIALLALQFIFFLALNLF